MIEILIVLGSILVMLLAAALYCCCIPLAMCDYKKEKEEGKDDE